MYIFCKIPQKQHNLGTFISAKTCSFVFVLRYLQTIIHVRYIRMIPMLVCSLFVFASVRLKTRKHVCRTSFLVWPEFINAQSSTCIQTRRCVPSITLHSRTFDHGVSPTRKRSENEILL